MALLSGEREWVSCTIGKRPAWGAGSRVNVMHGVEAAEVSLMRECLMNLKAWRSMRESHSTLFYLERGSGTLAHELMGRMTSPRILAAALAASGVE